MTNSVILDAFDHRLLERVRRNTLEPARVTAEAVGLSESAVLRRLRRLRAEGVIVADVAVIDPARVEPRIIIHVQVRMDSQAREATDAFKAALARSPEVQAAWDVTGETDFLVMLAVRSMAEFEAFGQRVLSTEAHVRSFKSMISVREVVSFDPARQVLQA